MFKLFIIARKAFYGKTWLNRGSTVLTSVKHNGKNLNRGPIGLMLSSIGLRIAKALAFIFAIALE